MTTILITGTNRGIGLEMAKQALAKGWTVYGSARAAVTDPDAHICHHPNFHDLQFDVTDHAAVRATAANIGIAVANLHPGWVSTDMGGADADIDAATSAAGILRLAEGLTLEGSGRFYNWDGSALDW